VRNRIEHEQQEKGEQAADHNDQPGQTHPISQQGRPVRLFPRDFGAHISQTDIAGIHPALGFRFFLQTKNPLPVAQAFSVLATGSAPVIFKAINLAAAFCSRAFSRQPDGDIAGTARVAYFLNVRM
jgi:hypothetical protein